MQAFVELIETNKDFDAEISSKGINFYILLEMFGSLSTRHRPREDAPSHRGERNHIFGPHEAEWKAVLKGKNRLVFHPEVPYEKLPEIFLHSRCVITSFPHIKRGLHDRILLALSQGATVLCNDNLYVQRDFPEGKAVLPILSPNYSKANERIDFALANEQERLDAVLATHTIRRSYTWDSRARTLVDELPPFL